MDSGVLGAQLGTAGTQILVIEDDPHMQKILQRIFREQGYSVIVCGDGQAGQTTRLPRRARDRMSQR